MHEIVDYLKEVDKFLRSLGGIPYSFRDPIEKWISERNQWIMYAAPECKTKEQATSAPLPNIWIGDPSEDGKEVRMGLSFQTKTLVETFMSLNEVPNRETRDKMLTILSKISKDWVFTIQQKTRWDTFATSPHYKEIEAIPCAEIDSAKLYKKLRQNPIKEMISWMGAGSTIRDLHLILWKRVLIFQVLTSPPMHEKFLTSSKCA
jgi:hypothetical protein